MEARVAKLEANVGHIMSDVETMRAGMADARERLAALEVKVDHLPSKGFIVTALIMGLAVIAGFIGYADAIQSILPGVNPQ